MQTRKERFAELNAWMMRQTGAWIVSIPGDLDVELECLPGLTVPSDLAAQGYIIKQTGEAQRILPHAVTALVLTEGSTVPIRVTHAGIARVLRYSFSLD